MIKLFVYLVTLLVVCKNVRSETEEIYIKLGDVSYDKIYYQTLPKNIEKTWIFTTDNNAKISLSCRELKISSRAVCKNEEVLVDNGKKINRYCGSQYELEEISSSNKMTISLKTSNEAGNMDCLVQAISGTNVDQYKNLESTEIDSSESGVTKGVKGTTCPCGWTNKKILQNMARIVNGDKAGDHEYPWMVAVRKEGTIQFCGGSILTGYHVLTAAHCTVAKHNMDLEVLVGSNIRWAELMGQRIGVKQIIEHQYDTKNGYKNDIAILVLKEKIKFNKNVGPICMPTEKPNINNKNVLITGWGYMQQYVYEQPDYLRKAHLRVVDFNTCSYKYNRKFDPNPPTRICTWSANKDTCQGDSGGPLAWLDPETNRYTQVGIVSFGRGCNSPIPKVYTSVYQYSDWIQQVIKDTSPEDVKLCQKVSNWKL